MTTVEKRGVVGRILFVSAILMVLAAGLIWSGAIALAEPARTYAVAALGAVAATDFLMGFVFLKGGR